MASYSVIGSTENVELIGLVKGAIPARVDTGARTSAIWASVITEKSGGLEVVFFDKSSKYYDGVAHIFEKFEKISVRPSTGEEQERYMIEMTVLISGRKIRARFTLADRSTQSYPILIGRNVLRGKFIVDVKLNQIPVQEELLRSKSTQKDIE